MLRPSIDISTDIHPMHETLLPVAITILCDVGFKSFLILIISSMKVPVTLMEAPVSEFTSILMDFIDLGPDCNIEVMNILFSFSSSSFMATIVAGFAPIWTF